MLPSVDGVQQRWHLWLSKWCLVTRKGLPLREAASSPDWLLRVVVFPPSCILEPPTPKPFQNPMAWVVPFFSTSPADYDVQLGLCTAAECGWNVKFCRLNFIFLKQRLRHHVQFILFLFLIHDFIWIWSLSFLLQARFNGHEWSIVCKSQDV